MKTRRQSLACRSALLAALALTSTTAVADERGGFEMIWFTIDGGGAMYTEGGDFVLSGTIGQWDAGQPMAGGSFILTGGFWPIEQRPLCIGDLNGSGDVGLSDLTILLSNFGCLAGCTFAQGDLDGDGDVALPDLTLLLSTFGQTCP